MIDPNHRFFAPCGDIDPGGPSTWHIVDWDQRRWVSVTMDEEQESEDLAFAHLSKHIDHLAPDVIAIHVSPDGDLISTSTDPEKDMTHCVYCPPLDSIERPEHVKVITRSELKEIDRIDRNVDVVVRPKSSEPTKKLIFKYFFLFHHNSITWHEMSLWMRLPKHPNIVPFDSIVVDELRGGFVGFTTVYIPGGTLEHNKTRVFKLKWLRQLIDVLDELNLNLGVAHQDVAPRNLLIDEATDSLMLFDFNCSSRIGDPEFQEARNDIKGTIFCMYEVITLDDHPRSVPHEKQCLTDIEHKEWVQHPDVKLDHPVSHFRQVLREWCEKRRAGRQLTFYKQAPNFLDWPPLPSQPVDSDMFSSKYPSLQFKSRTKLKKEGKPVLNWQRPPQRIGAMAEPQERDVKTTGSETTESETTESETAEPMTPASTRTEPRTTESQTNDPTNSQSAAENSGLEGGCISAEQTIAKPKG